jgi:hypothetical protein
MFQKAELARLQKQKDLLVLQSDVNRLLLAADWQRLRSPATWMNEAGNLVRRHPVGTAALAAGLGALAIKVVRQPGAIAGLFGRLGNLAPLALAGWKMFQGKKPEA